MNSTRSADRHMRGDTQKRLQQLRKGPRSVLIRADATYVKKPAGQHLLQMIVNLLARQYEVINNIVLDIPEAKLLQNTIPGDRKDNSLADALLSLAKAIAGPEINVAPIAAHNCSDASCTVVVGPCNPDMVRGFCVSAVAEGWRFHCSTKETPQACSGSDPNPLGPYMAACFAVGAVFKYFWNLNAEFDLCASVWGGVESAWNDLPVGRSLTDMMLPTTYLIGCGAVGSAFAFSLAAISGLKGDIVALDPQKTDATNRNRLLTMTYADTHTEKVILLAHLFAGQDVKVHPYLGLWPEYTVNAERRTPEHIQLNERNYKYEWVLSCVDRNLQRQNIAVYLPRHILGGSTQDFAAQVAIYSMKGELECLACNHPVPKNPPTEDLRTNLLGMDAEQLGAWFTTHDADDRERAAIEEYLRDPNCGSVGQADLAKLSREGETDWSVGFVSVGAGVLLASVYIQTLKRGTAEMIADGSEYFAWFLKASLGKSFALRKHACGVCTSHEKQTQFDQLWASP